MKKEKKSYKENFYLDPETSNQIDRIMDMMVGQTLDVLFFSIVLVARFGGKGNSFSQILELMEDCLQHESHHARISKFDKRTLEEIQADGKAIDIKKVRVKHKNRK